MKRMNYVVNKAKVAGIIAAAALVMAPVCVMADETAAPVAVTTEAPAADTAADQAVPTVSEDQTAPATSEDQAAPASETPAADTTSPVIVPPILESEFPAPDSYDDFNKQTTNENQPQADNYNGQQNDQQYEQQNNQQYDQQNNQQYGQQDYQQPEESYSNSNGKTVFETDNGGAYAVKEYVLWGRQVTGTDANGAKQYGSWEKVVVKSGGDVKQDISKHYDEYAFDLDVMWGTDHPYSNVFWRAEDGNADNIKISWGGTVRSVNVDIEVNGRNIYHETNCAAHNAFNGN